MPGITHWNHPGFFAYFPSNSDLSSVLADLVGSGLGAQGMSWLTSPAATEVEDVVMDWLRQMVGLPETFTGVIEDTASTSTFAALLCARERASAFSRTAGASSRSPPLVVYASEEAHTSIPKAAQLAGLGRRKPAPHRAPSGRRAAPRSAGGGRRRRLVAGRRPRAVVVAVGTTATTALDPLDGIADSARGTGCGCTSTPPPPARP